MRKQRHKRRRRCRHRARWIFVWALVILAELAIAAIPAGAAAFLLPMGFKPRGGLGLIAERFIVLLLFCGTYTAVHYWLCRKLFEEE